MGKGARLRADGGRRPRPAPDTSEKPRVGRGRPRGPARRALRERTTPRPENGSQTHKQPYPSAWKGFSNAITLGRSKVARWKSGRSRSDVARMDSYLSHVVESGGIVTLADVVDRAAALDQEAMKKR